MTYCTSLKFSAALDADTDLLAVLGLVCDSRGLSALLAEKLNLIRIDGAFDLQNAACFTPVSYTHLTLPTT